MAFLDNAFLRRICFVSFETKTGVEIHLIIDGELPISILSLFYELSTQIS